MNGEQLRKKTTDGGIVYATMHNGYREEFGQIKTVGEELGEDNVSDVGESTEVI